MDKQSKDLEICNDYYLVGNYCRSYLSAWPCHCQDRPCCFLFALKSLSIVIYSGFLYVVDGMLFPFPAADFCLNILRIGNHGIDTLSDWKAAGGSSAVTYVTEKSVPKQK